MSKKNRRSGVNDRSDKRPSEDRFRVETWLKIAEVLRWSPLFLAPMPVRVLLGLASGVFCAMWLERQHFGSSSWIIASVLFIGVLALLALGKGALSKWLQKRTSEIGGGPAGQVSSRMAKAFASEALVYCDARGSVPPGTTLENFRQACRPSGLGRRFNPVWWLVVTAQVILLSSFGLGGLLPKLVRTTSPIVHNKFVRPFNNEANEEALHTPLRELSVESSPVATLPPTVAHIEPQRAPTQGRSETPEEIARMIKLRSREMVQLENEGQLEPLMALYGPTVDYFGTRRDVSAIRHEKEEDFKKWVKRAYQVTSEPQVSPAGEGKWRVTFDQTFECENTVGDRSTGKIASALVFEFVEGSLRITYQDGPVSDYRKIARAEPAATPLVHPPDQVAEGPEPIDELPPPAPAESQNAPVGVINKVPDLRHLVNRKIKNDWLYGEFCLTGRTGNVAHCRTFARGIRFAEPGPTSLDIEFAGGLHFGREVSRILGKRQITFKVSSTDPIRLLSVTKRRDGNIHVRASFQGPLSQKDLHY